ncbi:MAG: hypothetical protein EOP04_20480 [Proteobacteria bacterium]|nr:MAG: hypothetical protein EOP04_20480 [Pseudomonadota bacterium]
MFEVAAILGVGIGGQALAGGFGAFQGAFTASLVSHSMMGQKPSVGSAVKTGLMCSANAADGAALGVGAQQRISLQSMAH